MPGSDAEEKLDKLLERFSEEAYEAGMEACRSIMKYVSRNPDMVMTLADTLPALVDSWALYTLSYLEAVEDPGRVRELVENLPSIVLSLVTSVYGVDLGVPVAVLLLIPAGPLTRAVAKCGRESEEPVAEPLSPFESRIRATIMSTQASVYRVYLAASNMLEETPGETSNLWKPRDMRILYM